MSNRKQRKLEGTAAALHQRYGLQALRKASNLAGQIVPPHISTSFPALDAITGCQGIPLGDITLLSGHTTSGKLTLADKTLMNAQRPARNPSRATNTASITPVELPELPPLEQTLWEYELLDMVVKSHVYPKVREVMRHSTLVLVQGTIQRGDGAVSVLVHDMVCLVR